MPGLGRLGRAGSRTARLSAAHSLADALHGGEDYELLFTLPPRARPPAEHEGVLITRIGTIRKGRPGLVRLLGRPLKPGGYDHFRGRSWGKMPGHEPFQFHSLNDPAARAIDAWLGSVLVD